MIFWADKYITPPLDTYIKEVQIVYTAWTGKYVPPGSPQVAPMGATWGLPKTKVHHMYITNPESTNFRKSEFQVWGLPGGYLLSNLFPLNFKDGGYLLIHSFIQWFNGGGYLWYTWGLPSNFLTFVRFQEWGLPGSYLLSYIFPPNFKDGGYLLSHSFIQWFNDGGYLVIC